MQEGNTYNEMFEGASRLLLKRIYVALIRSVLDYGCVFFWFCSSISVKKA